MSDELRPLPFFMSVGNSVLDQGRDSKDGLFLGTELSCPKVGIFLTQGRNFLEPRSDFSCPRSGQGRHFDFHERKILTQGRNLLVPRTEFPCPKVGIFLCQGQDRPSPKVRTELGKGQRTEKKRPESWRRTDKGRSVSDIPV